MSETVPEMRALALLLTVGLAVGCTPTLWTHEDPSEDCESPAPRQIVLTDAEAGPESSADRPIITTLRTRDHEVVIHGGDDGLRFTIAIADGTVLARMIDTTDFEARFPALYENFESAFAGDADGDGAHPTIFADVSIR